MADLPIPFTGPMIRALLREIENPGTGKTQTRRVLKVDPLKLTDGTHPSLVAGEKYFSALRGDEHFAFPAKSIRYAVGDRLYVREHWRTSGSLDSIAPRDLPRTAAVLYNADSDRPTWAGKHRQAMHMPKWASRITLIVTDVRVERLQDISEIDAIAEGMMMHPLDGDEEAAGRWTGGVDYMYGWNARGAFMPTWHLINGVESWEANPWVVAYTFRPILGNIDQIGGRA